MEKLIVAALLVAASMAAGCAPTKTLEQLELEASASGDWSAVEKRERLLARRAERQGPSCPVGYMAFCESYGGSKTCGCVSRQGMREIFAGR